MICGLKFWRDKSIDVLKVIKEFFSLQFGVCDIWFGALICWMSLVFSFVFLPKSKLYLLKFVPDFAASLYLTPAQVRLLLTEATFLRPPWWGLTYWKQKESLHLNHPVPYLHNFILSFFYEVSLSDRGWQGLASRVPQPTCFQVRRGPCLGLAGFMVCR